jgi:serine O-acetyltransferase
LAVTDVSTSGGASDDARIARGDVNANPPDIGLFALLAEDFRTHANNPLEPGFLAVALHRLGNARMDVRMRMLRAPLSLCYKLAYRTIDLVLGIDLPYTVQLGRRVRIWHHGGIVISARRIGDDVHIRHSTTFGLARRNRPQDLPIVGDRVDIGVGSCILGAVTVGHDCVIGAGSVVVRDLEPGTTAAGVPARTIADVPRERRARSQSGFRLRSIDPNAKSGHRS